MRILTGYMPATEGTARVAGHDVFEEPHEVKKRIGYLPERPPLYGYMAVDAYLEHVAELKGIPRGQRKDAIAKAISRCSLDEVSSRLVSHLSKGYQQRLGIAQAIIHDPQVLILDEPTIGLDPRQIVEIREMIRGLAGAHTIVLSTHILSEVSQICNKVIIINRGEIVASDTIEGLRKSVTAAERVRVRVADKKPEIDEILRALPGVQTVSSDGGAFIVEAVPGSNAAEAIARAVLDKKWGLVEVANVEVNIEDVFLKLIEASEARRAVAA
jgi:ABC-2 type transport system ATP-binding protein